MKPLTFENQRSIFLSLIITGLAFILAIFVFVTGNYRSHAQIISNPTKTGETGTFSKSGAVATFQGQYVDENQDVLIARISIEQNNRTPLPYKASDYLVTWSGKDNLEGIFGRYSTDGDLYVVIPHPERNKVYDIQITNLNYMGDDDEEADSQKLVSQNTGDIQLDESVSESLSTMAEIGQEGSQTVNKEAKTDSIAFHMILNPSSPNEKEYKIKTIKTKSHSLITVKNNKAEFDFKSYWNAIYRQPQISKYSELLQKSVNLEATYQDKYDEAKATYDKNDKDESAQQRMGNYSSKIETEQTNQNSYSAKLKNYQNLDYDDSAFSDYSTKIYSNKK